MKYILVTGGSGFIGSHLCEKLLELGYLVINLDNFNEFYNPCFKKINIVNAQFNPNYILIQADIRNSDILNKIFSKYEIDTVIHLAALAGVRNSIENPMEYVDVDINGTVNILESCRINKVKKIIFASSSSVYGVRPTPFHEYEYVDSQTSPYATAKAAGELYCRTYNNLYKIPTVCLRFFTVYGPRQRPEMAIHNFTKCIDEGREIQIFGEGISSRDYTYIDDIVQGIISTINFDCNFEIFNLGNSKTVNLNYLISLIENKLGKLGNKKYIKVQMGDVLDTCSDISKAQRLLNYNPSTDIEVGIEKFINWYNIYKNIYNKNF